MNTRRPTESGFTLIEILVALLISSIMIGVTVSQMSGSRALFQTQETELITEDNARFVFEVLSTELVKAGYRSPTDDLANAKPDKELFYGNCPGLAGNCTMDGGNGGSDRIAIWFRPERGDDAVACNGTDIDNNLGTDNTLVYAYYIQADEIQGLNSLFCSTFIVDNTGQAFAVANGSSSILAGLEDFQLLYGLDADNDSIPDQYITADRLTPVDNVKAVKVSILVSTASQDNTGFKDDITFRISGAPNYTPAEDDHCYSNFCKVFSTTIALRNATIL